MKSKPGSYLNSWRGSSRCEKHKQASEGMNQVYA
jgi:hypothetical protein